MNLAHLLGLLLTFGVLGPRPSAGTVDVESIPTIIAGIKEIEKESIKYKIQAILSLKKRILRLPLCLILSRSLCDADVDDGYGNEAEFPGGILINPAGDSGTTEQSFYGSTTTTTTTSRSPQTPPTTTTRRPTTAIRTTTSTRRPTTTRRPTSSRRPSTTRSTTTTQITTTTRSFSSTTRRPPSRPTTTRGPTSLRPDKTAKDDEESFGISAAVSPDYSLDIDTVTETKYAPPPLPPTSTRTSPSDSGHCPAKITFESLFDISEEFFGGTTLATAIADLCTQGANCEGDHECQFGQLVVQGTMLRPDPRKRSCCSVAASVSGQDDCKLCVFPTAADRSGPTYYSYTTVFK